MEGNAGRGTDLVDTAKFWEGTEPQSLRARLASNYKFGRALEEFIGETRGEVLNRGPNQLRVENELGRYKPAPEAGLKSREFSISLWTPK